MKCYWILLCVLISFVFAFTLLGCNNVKETNTKAEEIMNDKIPEVKEIFYNNSEVFLNEIESSKEYPRKVIINEDYIDIEKEDIVIVSSYHIDDCVKFSVFGGTIGSCNYSVSIVYFNDELYDKEMIDKGLIKLNDNWYIYKNIMWGV